jgi:hypothetical protein
MLVSQKFEKPPQQISGREKERYLDLDKQVVRWIAQAAINVELFTIPLYMTSMYSLAGYHQITSGSNDFYKGRKWPGLSTRAPSNPFNPEPFGRRNQDAFNTIFSVFVEEMLHLQMAANIATAIGVSPTFTSEALQKNYGWTCYGPENQIIPNIINLADTKNYEKVQVNIGPLNENAIKLFLAIEEPTEKAEIVSHEDHYFPTVPFADFNPKRMFGSIGWMYRCYQEYLEITYDDNTTLWDAVFNPDGQQNDLFNSFAFPDHPMREFMGFETTIALTNKEIAREQAFNMMNAITDQGEGSTVKFRPPKLKEVEDKYRADGTALISDYPGFTDTGRPLPPSPDDHDPKGKLAQSPDAYARCTNDGMDHYECFLQVAEWMEEGGIVTWDRVEKAGRWTPKDFITADYDRSNPYKLPDPERVATAVNNLYLRDRADNFALLSRAVVGAIKGVTKVLDDYWNPKVPGQTVSFPFPSMGGTADRMATCWAVFATTPDLSLGVEDPPKDALGHACQALLTTGDQAFEAKNTCADVRVFHTCRGSNTCKALGGCGFAQSSAGGGTCSTRSPAPQVAGKVLGRPSGHNCSAVVMRARGGQLGDDSPSSDHFTAPSDNVCAGFGGCAVPISASQLYPKNGTMDVYSIAPAICGTKFLANLDFKVGDKVEDIAYQAFLIWAKERGKSPPAKPPEPNDVRLAFPPST